MRLRARLLHVLVIAPVAATAAATLAPTTHAIAAGEPPSPPARIVVALDPGHGGLPDPSNPTQPFDPGAISASGLMEKVVTLDVAQRVAALLRADLVDPVLTRTSDVWVDIPTREQIAINAHAQLFVSIHCNSYADPGPSGSLVLYPSSASQAFAQTLEDSLGTELASDGVQDDGVVLRDNWWVHNPMPTGTVEMAYMSNVHDAALMATADFRQRVAAAIRDAIEKYEPQIAERKAEIVAWEQAHPGAPPPATAAPRPAARAAAQAPAAAPASGGPWGMLLAWLLLMGTACALVRWRRPILALATALGGTSLHRAAARRRRRRLRVNSLTSIPGPRWAPYSVYDELSL